MRIRATAAIAAVLVCAANFCSAEAGASAATPDIPVYGAGTSSCGQWLADDKNQNNIMRNTELSWVLGWLSATSAFMGVAGGHLRHTDANAVAAWVDKYCREHPLEPIYSAATALIGELAKPQ